MWGPWADRFRCDRRRIRAGKCALFGVVVLAVGLAGCRQPYFHDDPRLAPGSDSLFREIESIDLEEESETAPVHLDQAAPADPDTYVVPADAPTIELVLDEVREAALANNLELAVARFNPDIGQESLAAEEAKFDAVLTALGSVTKIDTPVSDSSDTTSLRYALTPGVNIPLRTGGFAQLSFPWTRFDNDVLTSSEVEGTDVSLSISQPLLRNAGVPVNTASIQVAKLQNRQQEAQTKVTAIRVLANAERAYWAYWARAREVETRHDLYRSSLEQLRRARRLADAGIVAEIEIVRSEAGVSRRLDGIIRAENQRRRAERNLKRIMNRPDLPLEGGPALLAITEPRPMGIELDVEKLTELAIHHRMDLLDIELQMAVDAIAIGIADNQTLPLVALDFNYSYKGTGREFSDSVDRLLDYDLQDWSAGVSFEIPIGNRAARARLRRAVLQRAQTLSSYDERVLQIRTELGDSLNQLEEAWQRILASRVETLQATRTLAGEERVFQAGIRTSTEVNDAAERVADAQSREISALAEYQIALVDVAFATGTLLGHSRIRWDG